MVISRKQKTLLAFSKQGERKVLFVSLPACSGFIQIAFERLPEGDGG